MRSSSQFSNVCFIIKEIKNRGFTCGFTCAATFPVGGDASNREMMRTIAELMTRINYQIMFGKFTMDFSDGEMRWEFPNAYWGDEELTPFSVQSAIVLSVHMVERYAPCFLAVIFGGRSAEDALVLMKKDDEEDD